MLYAREIFNKNHVCVEFILLIFLKVTRTRLTDIKTILTPSLTKNGKIFKLYCFQF